MQLVNQIRIMQESRKIPFLILIEKIGDEESGVISVLEKEHLPFEIKRMYWIHNLHSDSVRGEHAHKELEQIMIVISGQAHIKLEDHFGEVYSFELLNPSVALYVPKMMWRRVKLTSGATLVCLCSQEYREEDYIRDYQEFKNPNQPYVS
jgi:dTDP-4-dehydrorhamnose 3,5-epimerase-like enzyme